MIKPETISFISIVSILCICHQYVMKCKVWAKWPEAMYNEALPPSRGVAPSPLLTRKEKKVSVLLEMSCSIIITEFMPSTYSVIFLWLSLTGFFTLFVFHFTHSLYNVNNICFNISIGFEHTYVPISGLVNKHRIHEIQTSYMQLL